LEFLRKIEEIIHPSLSGLGYNIVRIIFSGRKKKTLQFMIERLDNEPIVLEDCEKVSRHLSVVLDVEDLIEESYLLEVSSPGINRPLVKKEDFIRFQGVPVVLQTHHLINNQKRFRGTLTGSTEEGITLNLGPTSIFLTFADISSARLDLENDVFGKKEQRG
jgi:ribosome maturation factor RimP